MNIQEQLRAINIYTDIRVRHAFVEARVYIPQIDKMGGVEIESNNKLKSYADAVEWLGNYLPPSEE